MCDHISLGTVKMVREVVVLVIVVVVVGVVIVAVVAVAACSATATKTHSAFARTGVRRTSE